MSRRYDLVVFDWDGTLMDSAAGIIDSMQAAAAALAVEVPGDAAVREVIGLGLWEACRALWPDEGGARIDALARAYRDHFLGAGLRGERPFDGVEDVLQGLSGAGCLLAVATGKGRAGLDRALQRTGFGRWMAATRCADETASKPDPRMLRELMEELQVHPSRTVMVGDTEYDLAMARAAGVEGVAVSYGSHPVERLRLHRPVGCVDCIRALPPLVLGGDGNG